MVSPSGQWEKSPLPAVAAPIAVTILTPLLRSMGMLRHDLWGRDGRCKVVYGGVMIADNGLMG
jgi:hypothetical protein